MTSQKMNLTGLYFIAFGPWSMKDKRPMYNGQVIRRAEEIGQETYLISILAPKHVEYFMDVDSMDNPIFFKNKRDMQIYMEELGNEFNALQECRCGVLNE